jgi:hypothetical protein
MSQFTETTVEELLTLDRYAGVAALYSWSTNYDHSKSPLAMFMDIIGYSEEALGENIFEGSISSMGYIELGHISDAMQEYVRNPQDVYNYLNGLIEAEMNEC